MARDLTDPRLQGAFANHLPHTITIQAATTAQDAVGQAIDTWADLADHAALPCAIDRPSGQEVARPDQTIAVVEARAALAGHYPGITPQMRAVADDGATYDILAVEHDSQTAATRLLMEVVT